jgi:hypothetical protein
METNIIDTDIVDTALEDAMNEARAEGGYSEEALQEAADATKWALDKIRVLGDYQDTHREQDSLTPQQAASWANLMLMSVGEDGDDGEVSIPPVFAILDMLGMKLERQYALCARSKGVRLRRSEGIRARIHVPRLHRLLRRRVPEPSRAEVGTEVQCR